MTREARTAMPIEKSRKLAGRMAAEIAVNLNARVMASPGPLPAIPPEEWERRVDEMMRNQG